LNAIRHASARKPVVVLKSGRTAFGKAATLSHTGSLSGEDVIYDGAFEQCGAIRVRDVYELFDTAKAFVSQQAPVGKRVAVVTTSGSLGAMTADVCSELGLEMASFSVKTVQGISQSAPAWMNVRNPLDLGPSGLVLEGLEHVLKDPGVDGAIVIFVIPYSIVQVAAAQGEGQDAFFHRFSGMPGTVHGKPVLFTTLSNRAMRDGFLRTFGHKVPILSRAENAAKAFHSLYRYGQWRQRHGLKRERSLREYPNPPASTKSVSEGD
jgi:acyl-CoA synthetase (NDP forming)